MKKLLILVLALVLCVSVFASCKNEGNGGQTTDGDTTTTVGGEDKPSTPTYDAQAAADFVKNMNKNFLTNNKTASDFTLPAQTIVDGQTYTITWVSDNENAKVVANEDNTVTIDLIDKTLEDINYKLTGTVTAPDGTTAELSFNLVIPKFEVLTYAQYAASEKGVTVSVTGIITGIFSKTNGSSGNGLYMQDLNNEGGYYIYGFVDAKDPEADLGLKVGMTVTATGTFDIYNGMYEVVDAGIEIVDSTIKTVTPVDYTEVLKNAPALGDASLVGKQSMLVTVKGVEIGTTGDNGYYYIKLGAHMPYIRISSSNNCITKDQIEAFKTTHTGHVGFTADVTGIIQLYNGNFYLIPADANCIANLKEVERTDAEKVAFELENLTIVDFLAQDGVVNLPLKGTTYNTVNYAWVLAETAHATLDAATGALTVTVPNEKATITLTLTATCGAASQTKTFEITLEATLTSIADIITIANGLTDKGPTTEKFYLVQGIITEIKNETYGNMYIKDAAGNTLYIYGLYDATGAVRYDKMEKKPVVGDLITVLSVVGLYNEPQLKNANVLEHVTPTTIPDAITIAGTLTDKGDPTPDKYLITGTITDISNTTYGNMNIKDEAGNIIYIYGLYDFTGNVRYDAMTTKPAVGDTITVLSVIGLYNNPQLKNAQLVGLTTAGGDVTPDPDPDPDPTPDPEVPTVNAVEPVVGNNYAVAMIQGNAKKVVYLKGGMSGYYMATSENKEEAMTVSLVATEGGYYLLAGDGTYINMVVSGTHVNGAYEAAPSTVYTYDATLKTLKAVVNGEEFIFGTRNDNTYLTVGPVRVSQNPFYCQFELAEKTEGGNTDTPVDPEPTPDPKPEVPEGTLVVGSNYVAVMNQTNAGKVVYISGGMSGYYMATSATKADAITFSVEATNGGFYLKASDGTYVNMVVSGTHVNGAYEAAPSTVYTYDAALKTLKATVNGEEFIFGTRNDKTYTTVGPVRVSQNPFYCQFELAEKTEGGNTDTPVVPDPTPDPEPTPDPAPTGALAVFEFGDNGEAKHVDGNALAEGTSYTSGDYTLTLTGLSKVYGPAYDAKGNSCIKIGTGSATAALSFTVGADVNKVVIKIAKYKANASKVVINGTQYELTTASNDGEYMEITVDTSVNKTIDLTTVTGGLRAMINSITYYG